MSRADHPPPRLRARPWRSRRRRSAGWPTSRIASAFCARIARPGAPGGGSSQCLPITRESGRNCLGLEPGIRGQGRLEPDAQLGMLVAESVERDLDSSTGRDRLEQVEVRGRQVQRDLRPLERVIRSITGALEVIDRARVMGQRLRVTELAQHRGLEARSGGSVQRAAQVLDGGFRRAARQRLRGRPSRSISTHQSRAAGSGLQQMARPHARATPGNRAATARRADANPRARRSSAGPRRRGARAGVTKRIGSSLTRMARRVSSLARTPARRGPTPAIVAACRSEPPSPRTLIAPARRDASAPAVARRRST